MSPENLGDPEQVRRRNKAARIARRQELADVRAVMGTREGRRFVWRLLTKFGATIGKHKSVLASSPQLMGYHSGIQDAGHEIEGEVVEAGEDLYFQMVREARADREQEKPPQEDEPNQEEAA